MNERVSGWMDGREALRRWRRNKIKSRAPRSKMRPEHARDKFHDIFVLKSG